MTQDEIVRRNLDLHAEWMRYAFEHPEVLDKIPVDAHLVIIPNDDPVMGEENSKIARNLKSQGVPVVIVHIDSPKPVTAQIEVA